MRSAMKCKRVRGDMVAWLDESLRPRRARQLARHVERCRACAAEADDLRASIALQQESLKSGVEAMQLDLDGLWRRTRRRLEERESEPAPATAAATWLLRPVLAVGLVSLMLWLGITALGGTSTLLISLGVEPPPQLLKRETDLFKNYPIIQELDVLERFHTADTGPAAEGVTPQADQG
jgi:Putative zinc-finger